MIIILKHVLIYQNLNFQGAKQFLFFLAFPGVAAGHEIHKSAVKVKEIFFLFNKL